MALNQDWPFPKNPDYEPTFRLLIEAGRIPIGATVTKRTGKREYILGDCLKVYTEKGALGGYREIKAEEGSVFLIAENGTANAIPDTKEVIWHASADELRGLVDPENDLDDYDEEDDPD